MFARYDTTSDKIFIVLAYLLMIVVTITFIYPFWDQVVLSLSTRQDAIKHEPRLFPWPVSFTGYRSVLRSKDLVLAFRNTVSRVLGGTTWTLLVTALAAYPLSRPNIPFKKFFLAYVLFTMMFDGGLIPNYLLRKSLGLLNKYWVMILPGIGA